MEKRKRKRVPRRFNVKFGEGELTHSGFTKDLSPGGAFIASGYLPPLGSRIHLQVLVGTTRCLYFEAVVCRQRLVPQMLRQLEQGGFGVAFRAPGELFVELIPSEASHANHLELRFADASALAEAWKKELKLGGAFVRTDRQLPRDAEVLLTLHLDWAGKSLQFATRVMQCVNVPGAQGLAVCFKEPAVVCAELSAYLTT